MLPKHLPWIVLAALCTAVGCHRSPPPSAKSSIESPQQLLDDVMAPPDQITPALLESDNANILFANQEIAFAQGNTTPRGDASSGPLTAAQAQQHLQTANLLLNVDRDRQQLQADIIALRTYVVPRTPIPAQ